MCISAIQYHECQISANTWRFRLYIPLMLYSDSSQTLLGFDLLSFRHYVILRYSHAVLDCVSIKAEVWTFPDVTGPVDQSGSSVWNRGTGASVDQLPLCSASFTFTLMFLSSST
ncbi:hypothetical protein T4E_7423 [Trichinella pseudospiralis]|uniref:Uncharacterized protein n=1 Tax=Trichinella pseudospiralis TaxID=6337 RepID=A0A0V0XGT4_TRIPS|nr:hypothetical protein T4E_7423 [Trichinella pseudospiralis]